MWKADGGIIIEYEKWSITSIAPVAPDSGWTVFVEWGDGERSIVPIIGWATYIHRYGDDYDWGDYPEEKGGRVSPAIVVEYTRVMTLAEYEEEMGSVIRDVRIQISGKDSWDVKRPG